MEGSFLKRRLRKEFRQRRRNLDPNARQSADRAIHRTLIELVESTACASLSAFVSFDGEPDLGPTLNVLSRRGVRIALPVIVDAPETPRLQFCNWDPSMPLARNFFGIDEPGSGDVVPPGDLDLVLLPLVAWDECGHRLGMGAGYYDRALASVVDCSRPLRVGIAYALQQADRLPADPWDVRLHQVITENGRFTCEA